MKPVDVLFVGAGLTTATIVSALRGSGLSMMVVECRDHIGGNCYDYDCGQGFVSAYGRHILHTSDNRVVEYLGRYVELEDSHYTLSAEIEWQDQLCIVPIPYQPMTEHVLGCRLSEEDIERCFFHDYSLKMWGIPYDQLPEHIRGRVPQRGDYFRNKSRLRPAIGWTATIAKMLGNTPVLLNASPEYWRHVPARRIVYCGRADFLTDLRLEYRTLWFGWQVGRHASDTDGLNYCHLKNLHIRSMQYGPFVCWELPVTPDDDDCSPAYPFATEANLAQYKEVCARVWERYPNLILAGRLGSYRYLDMDVAIAEALDLAAVLKRNFDNA